MTLESPATFNQASSYGAEQVRRSVLAWCARTATNTPGIISGGLLSASDCQLSAPGSGLSVNISTGEAIVGGSEGGVQGGYGPVRISSTTNLTISTANPTLPRIDTIALTIADSGYTEPTGVSGNAAVAQVVVGTATSGANLTNLTGKAALPASSLLLGYVLVPAAAANIITADIANVASTVTFQSLSGTAVRGAVNTSTSQSTSSTTYTTLATADQVAGIVLPTNGLIVVWYQATWSESVTNAARAAIFLGANQLKTASTTSAAPVVQEQALAAANGPNVAQSLTSFQGGLECQGAGNTDTAYGGDVATGQVVGMLGANSVGGACYIFANAGTYTVSVQFKTSSGTVTASNRKLWVQALPFS